MVAYATAALKFAPAIRDEIWPNAPIVFHSVSDARLISTGLGTDTAGISSLPGFGETIDLALKLKPETGRLAIIAGSSGDGREVFVAGE